MTKTRQKQKGAKPFNLLEINTEVKSVQEIKILPLKIGLTPVLEFEIATLQNIKTREANFNDPNQSTN